MVSRPLPAAFAHLINEANLAADDALAEVLSHLEPFPQAAALEILIQRGHLRSLAQVVGGFPGYAETLQRLIVARTADLSAGVRIAIASPVFEERIGAIEVIVQSDTGRLAYLLADALRSRCRKTRELAAAALHKMTERCLIREEQGSSANEIVELDTQMDYLAEALGMAVQRWEIHLQPKVLEAALWLGDRVEPAIRKKLQARRTKIARGLSDRLAGTSDPRLAGAALRALALPELRPAAARAISRTSDVAFLRAVLENCWLLVDDRIARGCRWVHDGPWHRETASLLFELEDDALPGAVRFLSVVGGPPGRKSELLRELLGTGRLEIRRAVLWQLVRDRSEAATDLLRITAARGDDGVATMASRELRRRRHGIRVSIAPFAHGTAPDRASPIHEAFDRYWTRFDDPEETFEPPAADGIIPDDTHAFVPLLRARLASSEPLDRARALRMISDLRLTRAFEDDIHRLTFDPDAIVRSVAVGFLASLRGPTTERLLRAAVNDPDERVEANAVEALDRLDVEDRVRLAHTKLGSPHGRVRANAIKSLIRCDVHLAVDALLDMLEDSSVSHRLSAVWVAQQVQSPAVLNRLDAMRRDDPDPRIRHRAGQIHEAVTREHASQQYTDATSPDAERQPTGAVRS